MSDDNFLPGFSTDSPDPSKFEATHFDLRLGDCVAGMKTLPDACVDLVVTSPPYNLGISYGKYRDTLSEDAYLAWSIEWAGEVKRLLKPQGSFFLNVGSAPANPWMPHQLALALRPLFTLQNTIHWIKSISVETVDGAVLSVGHFKPINSERFINDCHEFVFHFTHSGHVPVNRRAVGVPYVYKSNISRWGHTEGQDKRCKGNNWFIPYKTINSRKGERPHPATFPSALAAQCIALHGVPPAEMTMLEPFLGIGHAAIAAGEAGIGRFIGFEIDEGYFREAQIRTGTTTPSA